ncbi:MAG: FtsW/RodA/SpoVE family cell cycle protein, partial [Negativicutes bacterium]|nr:FtsW/RodA/SpoVE family cell cycle protein [Negativicutes bacterium]
SLLSTAGLVWVAGVISVFAAAENFDIQASLATLTILCAFFAVHYLLRRFGHTGDPYILPLTALLAGLGLIMVLRLKPSLFLYQAAWLLIGLAVFPAVAFLARRVEVLAEYKYLTGTIGALLLIAAILFGVEIGGNKNWIIVGPVRFQPSEFAKLFFVIFLAAYFNERREVLTYATRRFGPIEVPHLRFSGPLIAVWGLTMLMLVVQRDLGSALLYFGTFTIVAYLASGRLSYFLIGITLFLLGSVILYKLFPHVQTRVDIWLNPWADPNGRAYQIIQSLFALGTGGILGSGLAYGFPGIIPEVHTDFVFAAIGEELGLAGTGGLMIAYMLLLARGFRIALDADNPFSMLVAGGLSVFMALQIFLIIGGVSKFLPLTGITLPFVSYGGSSMVSNFILLGILFAISETRSRHV